MKQKITTLFILLGILIISVGCSDENKEHKQERLTNPDNDVPVP